MAGIKAKRSGRLYHNEGSSCSSSDAFGRGCSRSSVEERKEYLSKEESDMKELVRRGMEPCLGRPFSSAIVAGRPVFRKRTCWEVVGSMLELPGEGSSFANIVCGAADVDSTGKCRCRDRRLLPFHA